MAATGTEYVTLEQLKDLVTNMIQPLKDTVASMRKIVPVICADYDDTFVQLKLADGFSSSPVTMSSGDMMLIVNSEDGTYENGSYLLYTGSGMELTNSYVTWQKSQLTEYKTAASTGGTAELPDGTAMFSVIEEGDAPFPIYQLDMKTSSGAKHVPSLFISNDDINSSTVIDKSTSYVGMVAASEGTTGLAQISCKAANGTAMSVAGTNTVKEPDDNEDKIGIIPTLYGDQATPLTSDMLAKAEIYNILDGSGALIVV